jgi:hypothetical protein
MSIKKVLSLREKLFFLSSHQRLLRILWCFLPKEIKKEEEEDKTEEERHKKRNKNHKFFFTAFKKIFYHHKKNLSLRENFFIITEKIFHFVQNIFRFYKRKFFSIEKNFVSLFAVEFCFDTKFKGKMRNLNVE